MSDQWLWHVCQLDLCKELNTTLTHFTHCFLEHLLYLLAILQKVNQKVRHNLNKYAHEVSHVVSPSIIFQTLFSCLFLRISRLSYEVRKITNASSETHQSQITWVNELYLSSSTCTSSPSPITSWCGCNRQGTERVTPRSHHCRFSNRIKWTLLSCPALVYAFGRLSLHSSFSLL